jgi:hypothetical protein
MSRAAIEAAMNMPITQKVRRELVLPEDENHPKYYNRVVASGLAQFKAETGIPEAVLIRWLLLRYFMGDVKIGESEDREYVHIDPSTIDNYDTKYVNSSDEFIDEDDFSFPGG